MTDLAPGNDPAPKPVIGPTFWLQLSGGLAVMGIGVYLIVTKQGTKIGFLIACVGASFLPILPLALLGGLGLIGFGVWLAINAIGPIDYAYVLICVIVGGMTIKEKIPAIQARRWIG